MDLRVPTDEAAHCALCPRLVELRNAVRQSHPDYHAAPVAPWGRHDARLLIVGLAPGMHGANRSGRPFTGDASGTFLFSALHRHGFASSPDPANARLMRCRITNAVRCLPPDNRPLREEFDTCAVHLQRDLDALWQPGVRRVRVVLALGGLSYAAVQRTLAAPLPPFTHGVRAAPRPSRVVYGSYHPSRLNVNTRRLTRHGFDQVLARVRAELG
jgi:uracil-DNA glycosylase family 4